LHRHRTHRSRLLGLGLLLSLAASPGLAVAAPAPQPSGSNGTASTTSARQAIKSVTGRLHDLAEDNERLTERYNGARIELVHSQQRVSAALQAAAVSQRQLARSRLALAQLVVQQYQQPTFSRVVALMDSSSTGDYLSRMDTLSFLSRNRAHIVSDHEAAKVRAATTAAVAKRELAAARANSIALAAQRRTLQTSIAAYRARLVKLTAAQRAALFAVAPLPAPTPAASTFSTAAPSAPTPEVLIPAAPKSAPAVRDGSGGSAAARTAVRKALAQVGKPYVFATAGPSTYDCSGLTMVAWAAAGVSIPHQSSAQYQLGSAVSIDQLAPGDLVFFYQDLHHVGLYIGNGQMVHAPTTGDVVKVTAVSAFGSEYVGARRLG
jgi:cell wall-associated NlpC family hydrolase